MLTVLFSIVFTVCLFTEKRNFVVSSNLKKSATVDREYFSRLMLSNTNSQQQNGDMSVDLVKKTKDHQTFSRYRRGSPWPWYEVAKVDYKNDRRIHRETKREQEDHQKEYKKQFDENNHRYQEMLRVHTETQRETEVMRQQEKENNNGTTAAKEKRNKRELILY